MRDHAGDITPPTVQPQNGWPQLDIHLPFQAHSATQMCTGTRQNQFLFKIGHSPLISKPAQHINTHIKSVSRLRDYVLFWIKTGSVVCLYTSVSPSVPEIEDVYPAGDIHFEDVPFVEFMYPAFTCMSSGVGPLPSGTSRTPGLCIPWCCLPTSSSVCLVFFPLLLCLARRFWPDLMDGRHDSLCLFTMSGGLRVVRLPAGSYIARTSSLVTRSSYDMPSTLR